MLSSFLSIESLACGIYSSNGLWLRSFGVCRMSVGQIFSPHKESSLKFMTDFRPVGKRDNNRAIVSSVCTFSFSSLVLIWWLGCCWGEVLHSFFLFLGQLRLSALSQISWSKTSPTFRSSVIPASLRFKSFASSFCFLGLQRRLVWKGNKLSPKFGSRWKQTFNTTNV